MSENGFATFDQFPRQREYRTVKVPEMEHPVRLQSLTEGEIAQIMKHAAIEGGLDIAIYRGLLIGFCVVDAKGKRVFGDGARMLDQVGEIDAKVTQPLFVACQEFNSITDQAVEELEKN